MATDRIAESHDSVAPRSSRGRWGVAPGIVVLLVGTLLAFLAVGSDREGPLSSAPRGTVNGAEVSVNDEVTWGAIYILNDSEHTILLRDIAFPSERPDSGHGIHVLRVEVTNPEEATSGIGMAAGRGFETIPESRRSELNGYEVPPGRYANLLVNVRAAERGAWKFSGATIKYEYLGHEYSVSMPQALVLCVDVPECDIGLAPAGTGD